MIIVLGHKTPDTDAIVSSIVFAEYLNKLGKDAKAGALGIPNNETKFALEYWNVNTPEVVNSLEEGSKVALVDHNEAKQSHDDLSKAEICYIVDHHKFNLQTESPLYIYSYPYGCTSTILFNMFKQANLTIEKATAGLMLSAIISDTLLFRSPTTTDADKSALMELAKIAELDNVEAYSDKMFEAKSDLTGKSERDILLSDFKQFELAGKNVGVGVFETTNPQNALAMLNGLKTEMQTVASEMGLQYFVFSIVDIIKSNNYMVGVDTESEMLIEKAFAAQLANGYFLLPGIVSRKKQIIPPLESSLMNG